MKVEEIRGDSEKPVEFHRDKIWRGRLMVHAFNEAWHYSTGIDVVDLIRYVREHFPDDFKEALSDG